MEEYIKFKNVNKIYRAGEVYTVALKDVDFSIKKGEFVIILGASGAGKSTILNILGAMESPTAGKVYVDGAEISKYSNKKLTNFRRNEIGFVFQFYNLVQNLTVRENIELATTICKNHLDVDQTIKSVGLENKRDNFPAQLSGGEQQRASIARAIAKKPKLLLCDEPTGALDYETGKSILKLLQDCSTKNGNTVVIITHNLALAPMGDRIIKIKNGHVDSIEINETPMPVERIEW